ncbi:SDR family oxidoreductase [Streptomyces sp. NPDC093109]|uniref:SDR family oxidoreductase n=1 Tax=Streptomyces sp. NPDC093109 TaxID=3154977 RepID=UPI00344FDD13
MTAEQAPVARDLAGRVALVTGGGKGVGAAISRELARRGAHVIVNFFHSHDPAEATVDAIRRAGGSAEKLRASVAKSEAVAEMFDTVAAAHGGVDILVNNAARGVFAPYDDLTDREWQRALDTNVHGARWCALRAAPLMAARGGGAIVNVSSIGAGLAMDNYLLVGVCKAALEAMTRYLAADLGPLGIRVNTASAGLLDNATAALFPGARELRETCAAAAPLGRVGTEADLAQLVAFLASPGAGWVSGQSYLADGGLSVGRAMLTPRPGGIKATATKAPRPRPVRRAAPGAAVPDRSARDSVAVIGAGIVAPGAGDPDGLWDRLVRGAPAFSEPGERFALDHFWAQDGAARDRTYSRVAGYVRQEPPGGGDYLTHWLRTALRQCGAPALAPDARTRAACFVGAWNEGSQHVEESLLAEAAADGIAAHWPGHRDPEALRDRLLTSLRRHYRHAGPLTSHLPYAAARAALDGLLPARTPLQVIDTACSSSLYAIDLGTRALLDGDCDIAFCGGAFSLGPRYSVLFSQLRGLSRAGRVKAFDQGADGVLFSDGAGFVALKRLDRARADGDRVLGVLAGFGAASDGRGRAVHAPNRTGQDRALARARAVNTLPADRIDWVVAHATGTPVGDTVERAVLAGTVPDALCTSNKSVMGHTGWTAGVLSVVHALQGLAHSLVPAQTPYEPDGDTRPRIPAAPAPLPRPADRPRTVGISSFGFGGTNGHLLLQDPPDDHTPAPRSLPPAVGDDDPVVAVAWSAHLPGTPAEADVARRLAEGLSPVEERSFGTRYPAPGFSETRMPPRTAAAVDRAQLMALQAVARLARPDGRPLWDGLEETTGVFTAHTGVPASSADISVRCYAGSLTAFAQDNGRDGRPDGRLDGGLDGGLDGAELARATQAFVESVRERCPAVGEDTLAGLMPNVIPARVAGVHDLHGLTMTVDTGPTSGRTALTTAEKYLRRGDLDMALVLGVNGGSDPLYARIHGLSGTAPAEGAFTVVLTRASVARTRAWPVLAGYDRLLAALPVRRGFAPGRTYLAGDDLLQAIHHLTSHQIASRQDTLTSRHTLAWEEAGKAPGVSAPYTLPDRTLVITDPSCAADLRRTVRAAVRCRLAVLLPGEDPRVLVERVLAENPGGFRHLRVITSMHGDPEWPDPPHDLRIAVQEAAFLAVRDLRDSLVDSGSFGVAVLVPFAATAAPPHAHLFTGFVKSLAWELTGCSPLALLTDTADPGTALAALEAELGKRPDGLPVVVHRDGVRRVQRLHRADVPAGPLPLEPGAVVVATGGARGITAACMLGLARRIPVRLHLIGSSRIEDVPDEVMTASVDELPSVRAAFIAAQRAAHPGRPVREINARFEGLLHARESRLNLAALRDLCGDAQVHFHTCDVTDPAALRRVADRIEAAEGRVDLLVNGAGLHHPGDITRKDLPGMRRVRDVKLFGYHHLRAAFNGPRRPRLWCNFGSVTGVAGLPGESDYSPANDFLAGAAYATPEEHGEYTIAWTVWDETGLGSGAVVRSYTARTARLSRMTTEEGVTHFLDELRRRPDAPLVTFVGEPEYHSFDQRFPGLRAPVRQSACGPPGTPAEPAVSAPHPVEGLLGTPEELTADRARWQLVLSADTHPFLRDHVVDGRPTLPGVMMADIAVQAARTLVPDLPARAVEDLVFSAWVRTHPDGGPAIHRVSAHRTGPPARPSVVVTIRSDTVAPGGRVLARDREHFRAVVRLGGPAPLPAPPGRIPPDGLWRPVSDPYYAPASPVLLTGVFRATREWRDGPGGCASSWRPDGTALAALPDLGTPAVLLDSLARTPALRLDPDGRQAVAVPRRMDRITLYAPGADLDLARSHPDGIMLCHATASGISTALGADGQVLAQITGTVWSVLARLEGHHDGVTAPG